MTERMTDPTPEEIAAACKRIQATWSAAERYRRTLGHCGRTPAASALLREIGWTPPAADYIQSERKEAAE